MQSLACVSR
ncbi:unnamed protein product [Linum tenue]|uniref:Uncharacterized protein n=1 Tax=Linum tenue TaxID=586396 RepID=A0AAV0IWC5_9ROSI|nr:unnamed protein product [Linum tenue]CAI0401817.1 unnamed protein product [Linum tenue]